MNHLTLDALRNRCHAAIMPRKSSLELLLKKLFPIFAFLLLLPIAAFAAPRPNFLFVLIDDMGYGDLSCYGETHIQTTNLDQLAREGIRFTQFYVNAPICSPSRTALTTGQFPARWRMTSYLSDRKENARRGMPQWLPTNAPTLARTLEQVGYVTGHFGKWHMGGQRDVGEAPLITEYGFQKTVTTFEGLGDRILPILDAYDGKPPKKYDLGLMSEKLGRGKVTWMDRSTVTSGFVEHALDFIKDAEKNGKPFYVNVWPDDVHSPFFPPKALRGDGSKKQLYLGVVKATDEQLRPLLDYIRESPTLRTNTLIIVASDNGPEPGAGSPGPFRGHKGNLYEGGVREPFIVWGPGLLAKEACGTVNDTSVIAGVDLLPSIATLAGTHEPSGVKFDGEDFSATMLGREKQPRTKPLFWVRPPDRPGDARNAWPDLSVRDGDWKLLMMENGSRRQLYNLADDPREKNNLAKEKPEIVERLSKELLDWRKTLPIMSPPRWKPNQSTTGQDKTPS
ncbi:MAG TPA: sulfatase-like hydrolase/transferase [Verrucomicrobiae bacterium]|nr:sulfatase-like hydrolase/transferase [Verrucomicrobiae bacterium]